MKRVWFMLLLLLTFLSNTALANAIPWTAMPAYDGEMIEIPEGTLRGNTVTCLTQLSEEWLFISEDNQFVIVDRAGQVIHTDALKHPKLKKEASEIRGVYPANNACLLAVYDYQADQSYIVAVGYDDWSQQYFSIMDCCITDTAVTSDGFLIVGEQGSKRRTPWADLVAPTGELLWRYQNTDLQDSDTNITHRIEACETLQENMLFLCQQLDQIDGEYKKQYDLQLVSQTVGVVDSISILCSNVINTVHQLWTDSGFAYISCSAYDGEKDYALVIRVNLADGTQEEITGRSVVRIRQVVVCPDGFIADLEDGQRTFIGAWDKSGNLLGGTTLLQTLPNGRMTLLRMLPVDDALLCAGVISRQTEDRWVRTVCLIELN